MFHVKQTAALQPISPQSCCSTRRRNVKRRKRRRLDSPDSESLIKSFRPRDLEPLCHLGGYSRNGREGELRGNCDPGVALNGFPFPPLTIEIRVIKRVRL